MTQKEELKKFICVFCGAQNAVPQQHLKAGHEFGAEMAKRHWGLVYGGGDCGVMGAVANAVLEHKGWVTGVFPEHLRQIEQEHKHLSETLIVQDMHSRKQLMYKRADAFVIFPGGFGTMDETFEILTWRQIGLHTKPIIIFNHEGYWDHLVALFDNIIATGFATASTRDIYEVIDSYDALLERMEHVERAGDS
ncbi:MAG: TIGR00730 family Rossman fold protein [Alphaproteobacteria bacterium]|nr:MAG: TIGR00730 family Rossman fold protein [Alphaproteobacteria bacterium]TAF15235.1 MAG: TIGR00730 family Rossman fold protein [Alphaproteobacteria bacterium]TAF41055.1 MAG: TIGR00730 family Rossman fold protein [Alphaproteobacteria bacterium]TAF76309.1 MAG: TIGR00730 family Rossman fold protein [Alphaproteobacteria bacterium]